MTDIHCKIRKIREIKGYCQSYMATELDVSTKTYSRLENGETSLSVERLETIARIVEMEVSDILNFNSSSIFERSYDSSYRKD